MLKNRFRDKPSNFYSFSVDNGSYFVKHPFTTEELETFRAKMRIRDSYSSKCSACLVIMFIGIYTVLWLTANYNESESLTGLPLALYLLGGLLKICLVSWVSSMPFSCYLVGKTCPVNIDVDGVSYCSALRDLEYVENKLSDSELSDSAKRLINKVQKRGRPITRFEYRMILQSSSSKAQGACDILSSAL